MMAALIHYVWQNSVQRSSHETQKSSIVRGVQNKSFGLVSRGTHRDRRE